MSVSYPKILILLQLIILTMTSEEYEFESSSLFHFLQVSVIFSLFKSRAPVTVFEPTITESETAKTVHVLDRSVTGLRHELSSLSRNL
jgi:hypothetical protein